MHIPVLLSKKSVKKYKLCFSIDVMCSNFIIFALK